MPAHLGQFLTGPEEFVALGELADDLIRRMPRRRLFDVMSLLILPARTPGNRVPQRLDHYDGLTSVGPTVWQWELPPDSVDSVTGEPEMSRTIVQTERIRWVTGKPFDAVLSGIYQGIGRPDIATLFGKLATMTSFDEFAQLVNDAVGPSNLMQFLRLDENRALAINPAMHEYRLVRIIAGNPLTMSQMTDSTPDAGSYAPVTILVWERDGQVHVAYDSVVSSLSEVGSDAALEVARMLDAEVIELLSAATST